MGHAPKAEHAFWGLPWQRGEQPTHGSTAVPARFPAGLTAVQPARPSLLPVQCCHVRPPRTEPPPLAQRSRTTQSSSGADIGGSALGGPSTGTPPLPTAPCPGRRCAAQRPGGSRMLCSGTPRRPRHRSVLPGAVSPQAAEPRLPARALRGHRPRGLAGVSRGGRRGSAGCSLHTDI